MPALDHMRWILPSLPDAVETAKFALELNLPEPVAGLLIQRGFVEVEAAKRFLNPRLSSLSDPFLLPDMALAVTRTWLL